MEHIYSTMKSVILRKNLPVAELQRRIDIFFAQSKLTEEQKNELEDMVFSNQTVDAEKASLEARYEALLNKYNALEERVAALEKKGESDGGEEGSDTPVENEIPAWEPWDGVSTNYQLGAVVTHNGKVWKNVLADMQNVWEPGVVGERYWIEHVG